MAMLPTPNRITPGAKNAQLNHMLALKAAGEDGFTPLVHDATVLSPREKSGALEGHALLIRQFVDQGELYPRQVRALRVAFEGELPLQLCCSVPYHPHLCYIIRKL
jgi:hypothetical protein